MFRRGRAALALFVVALGRSEPCLAQGAAGVPEARPVVLELFTSQGCSSCPAADRVLSRLGLGEATRGMVVPLAYHVDYWDQQGWSDRFGSRRWSMRQEDYRRALGGDDIYTPQLVVNGGRQFPGGSEQRALQAIASERAVAEKAGLRLTGRSVPGSPPALAVGVSAEALAPLARGLDVFVVVFENGLVTPVGSGENGGRTLRNDFVVRQLVKAFVLRPQPGSREERSLEIRLDASWKPENLGLAGFLQDPRSMRIFGAAVVAPGTLAR